MRAAASTSSTTARKRECTDANVPRADDIPTAAVFGGVGSVVVATVRGRAHPAVQGKKARKVQAASLIPSKAAAGVTNQQYNRIRHKLVHLEEVLAEATRELRLHLYGLKERKTTTC